MAVKQPLAGFVDNELGFKEVARPGVNGRYLKLRRCRAFVAVLRDNSQIEIMLVHRVNLIAGVVDADANALADAHRQFGFSPS